MTVLSASRYLYRNRTLLAFALSATLCSASTLATATESSEALSAAVLAQLGSLRDRGHIAAVHVPVAVATASQKLIVLIQDIHVDYDSQQQIAAVLEAFIATHGLRLILAEGGDGDI